jgi:type II secretory pathway pseudopilin PulG
MRSKKGQIWVETTLYTLLGVVVIGIVLFFVTPKITETRDRILVEQTIESLSLFDRKINSALVASGNSREIEYNMKAGDFYVNTIDNKLVHVLSGLKGIYSEPGTPIRDGDLTILTTVGQNKNNVTLTLDYDTYIDITFGRQNDIEKHFTPSTTPYKFLVTSYIDSSGVEIEIQELTGTN